MTHDFSATGSLIADVRHPCLGERLSCHRFRVNEVRLLLWVIAQNLGSLMRRLVLPVAIQNWSLTSLQQRLFKRADASSGMRGPSASASACSRSIEARCATSRARSCPRDRHRRASVSPRWPPHTAKKPPFTSITAPVT